MLEGIKFVNPVEIEKKSFEIIEEGIKHKKISPEIKPIVKRIIHTTADFDYADNICSSENAVKNAVEALKNKHSIFTDTTMAFSGINKTVLEKLNVKCYCFIGDEDVKKEAQKLNVTRSAAAVDKACAKENDGIFVVGNAPTALIRLYELIEQKKAFPSLIIGVPVGFVNVEESKELITKSNVPYIVSKGRKGGSNVAAAIVNALIYMIER